MTKREIVEVARKAISGNAAAFEDLCREKQRDILFVALTILNNEADAEDAAQEAILHMHKSIRHLRDANAIHVWIEKIVRNESYKIYNARARKNDDADIDDETIILEEEDREFLPEAYAIDVALSEKLYEQIRSLAPAKRDAIIMYYYEGLSYQEIAEVTGTSMKTVSSNLTKARLSLKKKLLLENAEHGAFLGMGIPATSTVFGKSLALKSVAGLPDAKMAAFELRWMPSIHGAPLPGPGLTAVGKTVAGVVAGAASVGVIAFAVVSFSDAGVTGAREIIFAGDDCACGHINPQSVTIASAAEGDGAAAWQILSEPDGAVIFTGGDAEISAELRRMSETIPDGKFILRGTLHDKRNRLITLERAFIIGNYSGDTG
ncbi:MAG: sigma-70 family RNA polymerase sigma factor [Clostridiales Family XIII bacterium]|nr:sigma-70 family RNA polymerase sigma factor [Clostridiales Family XIII bacterium]